MFKWWILCLIGLMCESAIAQDMERPVYLKAADRFTVVIVHYCASTFMPRIEARLVARKIAKGESLQGSDDCSPADGDFAELEVRGYDLFRDPKTETLYITFRRDASDSYWFVGRAVHTVHLVEQTKRDLARLIKRQKIATR